jgi:hypothetical protein
MQVASVLKHVTIREGSFKLNNLLSIFPLSLFDMLFMTWGVRVFDCSHLVIP